MNQNTDPLGITNSYCPPEIKDHGKSQISPKSDIFSLALFLLFIYLFIYMNYCRVLYELVTERRVWSNYLGKGPIALY